MAAVAAGAAALVVLVAMVLSRSGASWPASVTTVQNELTRACQNPDVRAEPSQVNFACGEHTRQILWVLALLTSGNNPHFASAKTGRVGLEPITPSQGGAVAWTLNLHHPYDPTNPIDSLQVAARAINNIIGGATLTRANGQPDVQPGLESEPANCQRYTGSAALTSRQGYPRLCASPIDTPGRAGCPSQRCLPKVGRRRRSRGGSGCGRVVPERQEPRRPARPGHPQAPGDHRAATVIPIASPCFPSPNER